MGCVGSKEDGGGGADTNTPANEEPPKTVDPRLPFETYRQLFNMKNSWKAVSRSMEKVAKDNLARFFKQYPEHKALHKDLAKFDDDKKMVESNAFEMAAVGIFNTIDFAMSNSEKVDAAIKHLKMVGRTHKKIPNFNVSYFKVDAAIKHLKMVGRTHKKIPNFNVSYFKDMETSFLAAVKEHLGDRFTEPTENNFRLLYAFVLEHMIVGFES